MHDDQIFDETFDETFGGAIESYLDENGEERFRCHHPMHFIELIKNFRRLQSRIERLEGMLSEKGYSK